MGIDNCKHCNIPDHPIFSNPESEFYFSCSDCPCCGVLVLGWYKDNPFSPYRYGIVRREKSGWVFDYGNRYITNIIHWMPLHEPVKGGTPDAEKD